jgi:signal transduction histidine kinase
LLQHPDTTVRVVTDIASDASDGLFDERLLRHIFENLLSNAIKYSPNGGEVRLQVRREGLGTVFALMDQGIGIPAPALKHLFEPFHRAGNVGDIEGSGLGLAIVKSSVDLHGGHLSVLSQTDHGTCFTLRIG